MKEERKNKNPQTIKVIIILNYYNVVQYSDNLKKEEKITIPDSVGKEEIVAYLDGPFGAPAEQYKNYENLIFIASGVGATPFSSILLTMLYQIKKGEKLKHRTVTFYWIQREYGKTDYLTNILQQINTYDREGIFEINIFITGAQQKYDLRYY